eukprot:24418-Pleurochrysis_carterae.AAC.1
MAGAGRLVTALAECAGRPEKQMAMLAGLGAGASRRGRGLARYYADEGGRGGGDTRGGAPARLDGGGGQARR